MGVENGGVGVLDSGVNKRAFVYCKMWGIGYAY